MLSVRNISKTLGSFSIDDISFDVSEAEYFVLLGESGVGKTVLLETIAGLLYPDAGQGFLAGKEITNEKIQKRRIALVYQDQALFPHLSVRRNVAYGVRNRRQACSVVRERINKIASDVGISELLDRSPKTLSCGEAQRVALARALATEPLCLLLDEPMSSLDVQARSGIRALLRKIHRKGQTVVHVTHDYEEAVSLASRIAVMEQGRITQVGTTHDVFTHPKSEFVARFVGIRNVFKGKLTRSLGGESGMAEFITEGVTFAILTDAGNGAGSILLRGEDITVSNIQPKTSARNAFEGIIVDIEPARLGCNVLIDIGVKVCACITTGSAEALNLTCGEKVWSVFKASALRFLEE